MASVATVVDAFLADLENGAVAKGRHNSRPFRSGPLKALQSSAGVLLPSAKVYNLVVEIMMLVIQGRAHNSLPPIRLSLKAMEDSRA